MKSFRKIIRDALHEDAAGSDITSRALFENGGPLVDGFLIAKQDLVVSGLDVAREVFQQVSSDIRFRPSAKEGDRIRKGKKIAAIHGPVSDILRAERVALNFLQHLSGIATLTRAFVDRIKPHRCQVLDTRKTVPGLRLLEKMAVRHGGGHNHRLDLSSHYLIKDNHIDACGGVGEAIARVKGWEKGSGTGRKKIIEVEAGNMREVRAAVAFGVDILLLDNMNLSQIRRAVATVKGKCLLEVSGGVNLRNVRKIAGTGVARISIGRLTHSAPAVDISLELISPLPLGRGKPRRGPFGG